MSIGSLTLAYMSLLLGQTPGDIAYHNQRAVRVPINITESRRAEFKALLLFASDDQGRSYHEVGSILPNKAEFIFTARADGSYWLKAAAINQQGKQEPDNIQNGPPDQKLVIDTTKPALRITSVQRQGDEVMVAWEIQEEHPDWSSFKLEYQVKDSPAAVWTSIPATAGLSGKAQFRPGIASPLVIRLTFKDLAENLSTVAAEVQGTVVTTGFSQNPSSTGAGSPSLPAVSPPVAAGSKSLDGKTDPVPPPLQTPESKSLVDTGKPPPMPPNNPWVASPPSADSIPGKPVASTEAPPTTTPPAPVQKTPLPPLQYVNHPRVVLEYELNKVGPSGVGRVELWYTTNDGQSWELCADDPRVEGATSGGRHQRAIDLPGDGVYGFHLVVKSRAGLGKPPPRAGDPPQIRFEVDTSIPVAQLFPPVPDAQSPGALLLRWVAKDNNLAETPITLEWAEHKEGPWTPIAANIPNTGRHSWHLPERMPVQAFLRLRVRDLAGNEGVAVTGEPQLIDLSEPEGRLVNVSVSPKR
ncbi:MAG: hypothetical protein HY040_23050 [Planctomycetes bacterium]|nr:hypothetical protein [Planctomycetota bacterium]